MSTLKITGVTFLVFGFSLIVYALFSSYNIFIGKTQPPVLFSASNEIEITNSKLNEEQGIAIFIDEAVKNQIQDVLPSSIIFHFFNLISWSIFAWILIIGGFHVFILGTRIIKA